MVSKPSLNGNYLVTYKHHVFGEVPEIFLLLDKIGPLKGICVNKWHGEKTEGSETLHLKMCNSLSDIFIQSGAEFYLPRLNVPLLNGGPDNQQEYYVLHTGYEGSKNAQEYLKELYYISSLQDFASTIKEGQEPAYAQIMSGIYDVNMMTFAMAMMGKGWEIRSGLHFMTYGFKLERKMNYVQMLKKHQNSDLKVGDLDLGAIMNQLLGVFAEAGPSIMAMSVYGYLKNETDLNEEEIIEVTRAMLSVSEVESQDLNDVMKKYTHREFIEKMEKIRDGGMKIKLLEEYDTRRAMLIDLGMNPLFYDNHVWKSFSLQKQSTAEQATPLTGKAKPLAKSLNMLARIIKGRKSS